MRWPTLIVLALLLALQYPLWFGKGGWSRVREAEQQVESVRKVNQGLESRNAAGAAEVQDLKTGFDAIEERARFELGVVKPGEIFVQVPDGAAPN